MEIKYSADINTYKRMTTGELRNSFMVEDLFKEGKIQTVYSDVDRAIIGSAVPLNSPLLLESSKKEMAADYFAERREIGIINIGHDGSITADDKEYVMNHKDGLYIGRGTRKIEFKTKDQANPAKFYFMSYPSHKDFPTECIKFSNVESVELGSSKDANKRTINKYIHLNGIKSSQLVMGLTELDEGSVWNTMPAHTHIRRSEIYMYFNLDKDSVVFHMMGEPTETRSLVIRNEQAVISPSWSIHCGAATKNYSFIWAMGGENQVFEDMDPVTMDTLK
ncbi:MAG: 5-dehydro-4-deoxy-D-glucuronate isomerase [Ignavibacteriales bacterium]|nr:MAG: 5-dehydro-4-deoxy-D-glucuronate isomerase [Ignavibacteriales bacterium]